MTELVPFDPSLAQQALDFLLPHLKTTAGRAVDKTLEAAGKGVVSVYSAIKNRLTRVNKVEALAEVEKMPGDGDAVAALRLQLRKLLEADPVFRQELTALLVGQPSVQVTKQEAYADHGSSVVQVSGSGNTVKR